MCLFPQLNRHITHPDYYFEEEQAAGIHFKSYSSSAAQTSGEEGLIMLHRLQITATWKAPECKYM